VILLIQFRIALQIQQTIGAQFKITEKFVSKNVYKNMIGH